MLTPPCVADLSGDPGAGRAAAAVPAGSRGAREGAGDLAGLMPVGCGRLILLNANASDLLPLRKWDEKNYLELAEKLLAEFGDVAIGFTGAPEEQPKIEALVREIGSPRCFCLAGKPRYANC